MGVATEFAAIGPDTATLAATKTAAEALVIVARSHAEDLRYESPFAVEYARELGWGMGRGLPCGGKMDDITVVVGKVVATEKSTADLQEAKEASEKVFKTM